MDNDQDNAIWLVRVAWGLDHIPRRHRDLLIETESGGGHQRARAYGRLRRKIERRFRCYPPENLSQYVRAIRRLRQERVA